MVYMEFRNYKQEAYAASLARRGGGVSHNVAVISTLRDRNPVPQPEQLGDAEAKWGKDSTFSWGSKAQDFNEGVVPSTTWEFNDDPEIPQDPEIPDDPDNPDGNPALEALTDEWNEVDRKETQVRIDGPDGAYVDFMRIDEVKFQVPSTADGRDHYVVLKFKSSGSGTQPKPPGKGSDGSGASGAIPPPPVRDSGGPGSF